VIARSGAAVRRALALDPSLPAAHEARGWYALYSARDYDRALSEFAVAERSRPNDAEMVAASAYVDRRQGRWDDAIATLRRATALDPHSVDLAQGLAETYLLSHRYAEADSACARAIALAPDVGFTYWMRMMAAAGGGGGAAAVRTIFHAALAQMPFGRLMAQARLPAPVGLLVQDSTFRADVVALTLAGYGPDSVGYYRTRADSYDRMGEPARARVYFDSMAAVARQRLRTADDYAFLHAALGAAEAGLGHRDAALAEARRAEQLEPIGRDHFFGAIVLGQTAPIYLAVGMPDSAIARLRTVIAAPSFTSVGGILADPQWAPLRKTPEFQRLVGTTP
jgi:tetratricopeptide (TPR) repeat protein